MNILMMVVDGMADEGNTALMKAKKPNMDRLCKQGVNGYFINKLGKQPDSDLSNLYLLGYTKKDHPGRGYIEALAVTKPGKKDLCIRCNFATVKDGKLVDRRAGREEKGLDTLAKKLNMTVQGVKIRFKHTTGHRGVLLVKGLSDKVSSNDRRETGRSPKTILPSNKTKFAKKTASILREFVERSHILLSKHPVNKKRKTPANYIILRSMGKYKKVTPFKKKHGLSGGVVSATTDIIGLGEYLKMKTIRVGDGTPNTNLKAKLASVKALFKTKDFVFLHIKATDSLSHDHDCQGKEKFIERIDKELIKNLPEDMTTIITADHICACRSRDYGHHQGLVPVLIHSGSTPPDKINTFNEKTVLKGSLGEIKAENLVKKAKRMSSKT